MFAASIVLCTLGGVSFMEGKWDRVRRAIVFSVLVVGVGGIVMSGGCGITTLGSGAWVVLCRDGK